MFQKEPDNPRSCSLGGSEGGWSLRESTRVPKGEVMRIVIMGGKGDLYGWTDT